MSYHQPQPLSIKRKPKIRSNNKKLEIKVEIKGRKREEKVMEKEKEGRKVESRDAKSHCKTGCEQLLFICFQGCKKSYSYNYHV